MQKNFLAFVVCSFLIMFGWSSLQSWLHPAGTLVIEVDKDVKLDGVTLKVSGNAQKTVSIDLAQQKTARLPLGTYKIQLENAPETLELEKIEIEIIKGKLAKVALTQTQIAQANDPQKNKPIKKPDDPDPKKPNDDEPTIKPAVKPDDVGPPTIAAAGKTIPSRRLSLGSLATDSGYRMLATLTSQGAAIERIELNQSKFHDLEDRSGYLGHLAVVDDDQGVRVRVVGPGTPAAIAGLEGPSWKLGADKNLEETPGDVITSVDGVRLDDLDTFKTAKEKFYALLSKTKPDQTIELGIRRAGQNKTLSATLVRRPLEVVRPEIDNSVLRKDPKVRGAEDALSFLLTLNRVNKQRLDEDDIELEGVTLRQGHWQVLEQTDTEKVVFYRRLEKLGLEIRKIYQLRKDAKFLDHNKNKLVPASYHLSMSIEIKNIGKEAVEVAYQLDGPTGMPTEGSWYAYSGLRDYIVNHDTEDEKEGEILRVACQGIAQAMLEEEVPDGVILGNKNALRYIGVDTQYFAAVLLPRQECRKLFPRARPIVVGKPDKKRLNLTNVSTRIVTTRMKIAPGGEIKHEFDIFAGPKLKKVIALYGLSETVDYGMFAFVSGPMQWILHQFHDVVHNFGIAIIMLTVLVRLCMFPLSRKQVLGAQKMQELQPEMKRINEKYKKNMEARNKATQALFRKHNYNPLGGCVLIFFQFPIFIGLYRSLQLDVELRQASLYSGMQWCSNLAAPDMLLDWSNWAPGFIQNGIGGFMALGPYFNLLPIFTVALFVLQQKMFTPPPTSEQAEMQQKIMKYMMLVIGLMFYKVASGLCLYFIVSSLWGLGERKLLPKPKPKSTDMETSPATTKSKSNGNGTTGKSANRKKKPKGR